MNHLFLSYRMFTKQVNCLPDIHILGSCDFFLSFIQPIFFLPTNTKRKIISDFNSELSSRNV